jgi:hypothetical protein
MLDPQKAMDLDRAGSLVRKLIPARLIQLLSLPPAIHMTQPSAKISTRAGRAWLLTMKSIRLGGR